MENNLIGLSSILLVNILVQSGIPSFNWPWFLALPACSTWFLDSLCLGRPGKKTESEEFIK